VIEMNKYFIAVYSWTILAYIYIYILILLSSMDCKQTNQKTSSTALVLNIGCLLW